MGHMKFSADFEILTDHLILGRRPDLVMMSKKKKNSTRLIVDFAVLADHRMKIKENENKGMYLDLAKELR